MTALRQKMIDAMQVRGFSVRTHESYLAAVSDLARYYHRPPDQLNVDELQAYFLYLVKERGLSGASCRLYLNGIRFLYVQVLNWQGFDHACRDRHCPRCQQRASRRWCERQQAAVLPVGYYHVVFTLPHTLNRWVHWHPEVIYGRLFQSVWTTLKRFAADPKRLGGGLGMSAVLHTWAQNLSRHAHLHCLIPGGAVSPEGQWKCAKSNYLFPECAACSRSRYTLPLMLSVNVRKCGM